jgi:molybdenum cofactor biosynthesis protein B
MAGARAGSVSDDERGGEDRDGRDDGDGHGGHEGHEGHDGHDGHDGHGGHGHHHHDVDSLGVALLTVTSTRTLEDDPAGDAIVTTLTDEGHEATVREAVDDDYDLIQSEVNEFADRAEVDVVVTTGGTGVTPDDVTVEAVETLFDKHLPGFGELFRRRSYDDIGSRVVGTRATAGVVGSVPVFCLPGSENAARLGADLVVAEGPHLAGLASRDAESDDE